MDPEAAEARALIEALDEELRTRYPGEETNGIETRAFREADGYFAVLRDASGAAVACGGLHRVEVGCGEIKRMFVRVECRGRGLARALLVHLEAVAAAGGWRGLVLETGTRQPEASELYQRSGFFRIPRYGKYAVSSESVCFAKAIGAPGAGRKMDRGV